MLTGRTRASFPVARTGSRERFGEFPLAFWSAIWHVSKSATMHLRLVLTSLVGKLWADLVDWVTRTTASEKSDMAYENLKNGRQAESAEN